MAGEVLMRQAKARADRTGESIEEALEAVLNTRQARNSGNSGTLHTAKKA